MLGCVRFHFFSSDKPRTQFRGADLRDSQETTAVKRKPSIALYLTESAFDEKHDDVLQPQV